MFDTYTSPTTIIDRSGPSRVDVTVHEHRAPTDESIRLAHEMRAKIVKDLLFALPVDINGITGECRAWRMPIDYNVAVGIAYKINGVKHTFVREYADFVIMREAQAEGTPEIAVLMKMFCDDFGKELARTMILSPAIVKEIEYGTR